MANPKIFWYSQCFGISFIYSFTAFLAEEKPKVHCFSVPNFQMLYQTYRNTQYSLFFFRTNLTIIQVKAACDGDNMRIVGELNTNQHSCTALFCSALLTQHTRFTCIHAGTRYRAHDSPSLVFRWNFRQRHFKHYSFSKLHLHWCSAGFSYFIAIL